MTLVRNHPNPYGLLMHIRIGVVAAVLAACAGPGGASVETSPGEASGTGSAVTPSDPAEGSPSDMTLSREERDAGFEPLLDGESLDRWRGFRRDAVPGGWRAVDGQLAFTPGDEGGDLITRDTYTDFDLRLEWRLEAGGNSGIFFGVVETTRRTYESGPEMQVLDNAGHRDGGDPLTSAGSNYGLYAPSADVTRPVGEWNEARIVRRGGRVEHWLNGIKLLEYELASAEWSSRVAASKFVEWPDYGIHHEGHIGLQDHGDPVWYRNIRIRRLAP
ncbi:MAG: DUF1080 domain-containing protein [Gemmatimonadetes bacterium]|nr:DUF1080 domain-containing protein [Gemmatimonadota bacterium]